MPRYLVEYAKPGAIGQVAIDCHADDAHDVSLRVVSSLAGPRAFVIRIQPADGNATPAYAGNRQES